ncbi:IclR family transcriptional regulator [Ramlibacter sp.]|uniref:IclR family transcriptional regulator n=1 Tax=Ramlibacter sp. TaxID=1917967 RepID=UPI003D0CA39B
MNNTLVNGLQLLELLVYSDKPLGVSAMAARLGLGKSNVHRLLQGLVELRYVSREDEGRSYAATLKVWELGNALGGRMDVRQAARASMEKLMQKTRETIHLSVLDGAEIVYLHKIDSPEPVRAYSEIGGRAPAHCVATGKALLAWQPEEVIAGLSTHLSRHSPNTIVDARDFAREMRKVRESGHAVNRGEWRDSVWGVAAPIRGARGDIVAAIGVSGPAERIRQGPVKRFAADVMEAAEAISAELRKG